MFKATKGPCTHRISVETVIPDSSPAGRLSVSLLRGSQRGALATGAGNQPPSAVGAVDGPGLATGRGSVPVVIADARLIGS